MPAAHRKGSNSHLGRPRGPRGRPKPEHRWRCQRTRGGGESAAWLDGRAVIPVRGDRPGMGEGSSRDEEPRMELRGHLRVRGPRQEQPQRQTRGGWGDTEMGRRVNLPYQPPVRLDQVRPSQKVCAPEADGHTVSAWGGGREGRRGRGSRGRGRAYTCG